MTKKGEVFTGKLTAESRLKMSQARLGQKASEETRAKLRVLRSKPRGCYRDKWETLTRLCSIKGWKYERTHNYWKIIDGLGIKHSFYTCDAAIAYLQGDIDYEKVIEELCKGTSYKVEKGWREYTIYHGKSKIGTVKTAESVVKLLQDFRSR